MLQMPAIERAEREREVGDLAVEGGFELRPERYLRRRLRTADRHHPAPALWRMLTGRGEPRAQFVSRLFEGEPPVVQHVLVLRRAHAAGKPVECRVLVGV